MHTIQSGLSLVAILKKFEIQAAKDFLEVLNAEPEYNCWIPFARTKSTLFVPGVVIPEQDYHGDPLPATLLLLTSYCGPLKIHLAELIKFGAAGLRELFQHTVEFPEEA